MIVEGLPDRRFVSASLIALILAPTAGFAQGSKTSSPVEFARQADDLSPGEWVWAPEIAPTGPVLAYVDLSRQRATVYRNGVRIGASTVSSGKPGHETPTRVFYQAVKAVLQPGATILVTQSSVGESAGKRLTVLDAVTPTI